MIMQDALPGIKRFFKPVGLSDRMLALTLRCVAAFALHFGRMSASQAAGSIRSQPRHRAQICRFLQRAGRRLHAMLGLLQAEVLAAAARNGGRKRRGEFLFLIDQTLCSQQGDKTENTFSTGNRSRRPRKGRRYDRKTRVRKRCHCFVMGLLITPSGVRIPFRRSYYTKEYCASKGRPYRTQIELAAEMIRELPLDGSEFRVLGDTAFEAKTIQDVCASRGCDWIVPMNPERVLAGAKPRPRVKSLGEEWTAEAFTSVRIVPSRGRWVAHRRPSASRNGPQAKPRVFYAHSEIREVHSVGKVQLVFSTRTAPVAGRKVDVQKILMTNDLRLSVAETIELYDLRWQIELFFKELKSTLGFDQYRFRRFERVESWLDLTLTTFLYLEWHRLRQLRRRDVPDAERERWRRQRTHGLCLALRQHTEDADLKYLAEALRTKGGIQRLKRRLHQAVSKEFRIPA